MTRHLRTLAAVGALLVAVPAPGGAFAQKSGGILRIPHGDSPASISTHDEATRSTATPMMGVFNNLVIFDKHVPHNTLSSSLPDLAVAWSWDEDKTALSFRLQPAVKCHDEVRHGAGSAVRFNVSAQSIDCWFDHLRGTQYAYLVLPKTPGGPILTLQPPGIRGTFG